MVLLLYESKVCELRVRYEIGFNRKRFRVENLLIYRVILINKRC